ncbi:odorant receptor 7a-like [Calliphora vicina]|uniref:odorant receptor 7a-like n=1 Tax=Calliphora vicina TaxID=7373 RepID=UPI00325B42FF
MFDRFWGRGDNLQATREATVYLFKNFLYLGFQQPPKWKPLYYLYSVMLNLSALVFLPISFILSFYYGFRQMTPVQLLTSLQVAINVWGLPAKFLAVVISLKRLHEAMDVMDILDARCQRQDEKEKIRYCAMLGNRLTIFFIGFYMLYTALTMITSVLMGQPPYSVIIPLMDWRNSTLEFIVQSFLEYMLMNLICMHEGGDDVYAVIYIYAIRTHMQILVERVKRLGTDEETTNDDDYKQLVLCVKDHQELLRLLDIISPVISITIFIQFMITAIILGTTLINIMIFADFSAQIASVVYFLAVLVQTSPCCYQATCLMDDSDQLTLAIFHCEWFNKDIRFRKMMIFFMMRSQTPVALTALKLFPITLNTSLGIAKFSFSLYTFIKEMDFGKNLKD